MTDTADPWESIAIPADSNRITGLRAAHPLNFYRGRDGQGNYLFWLDVSASSSTDKVAIELPQFTGLQITRQRTSSEQWRLLLSLVDKESTEIFTALCADLMDATAHLEVGGSEAGMHTVLGRLDRWYRMFRQARDRILTKTEQIGLAGELLFLTDIVMEQLSVSQAVGSWHGPQGAPQDFVLPQAVAEVKSGDKADVRISSEFQLDSANGPVVLVTQVVMETSSSGGQGTLAQIVQSVQARVLDSGSTEAADRLTMLLYEVGYTEREEYNQSLLLLSDRYYFSVDNGFPCITTSQTGDAISNVQYQLQLRQCEPWRISQADAIEILMGVE